MSRTSFYKNRVDLTLRYIRSHLDQELSVNGLAEIVGVSPFHFHRIYKSIMNETIYDSILRIRMETAVIRLSSYPDKSIIEIGLDVGFSNPSSFTRAFKRYFGFTPSEVQLKKDHDKSKIGTLKSKYGKELLIKDLYPKDVFNIQGESQMNVEIKNFEEQPVIALTADYTYDNSMRAWLKLHKWFMENKGVLVKSWNTIGLYYNDPTVTPLDKCQSQLCLFTSQPVDIKPPFISSAIAAGKYAIARYMIKEEDKDKWTDPEFEAKDMNNFIQSFYKNWLIESGHTADDYPLLMTYNVTNENPLQDSKGAYYFDVDSIDVMLKLK